jgi:hypothetical protein
MIDLLFKAQKDPFLQRSYLIYELVILFISEAANHSLYDIPQPLSIQAI